MSLDGLEPGPDHAMDWLMDDLTNRPGLIDDYDRPSPPKAVGSQSSQRSVRTDGGRRCPVPRRNGLGALSERGGSILGWRMCCCRTVRRDVVWDR
jgi:hypothetical protein